MNCFHCGNKLGRGDMCLTCGQDVRLYKKIVACSWHYYDEGLARARERNLSGAAESLRNSLFLYKKNTQARNLLGLIYYEMGDVAQALIEWVLSDNLEPSDSRAAELLGKVQSDQVGLERVNLAIRKYNHALKYAKSGSEDLAVLQLNKVLSVNPRMVSANLLMALLQLHLEQPEKAEKYVQAALKVDRCNAVALHYRDLIHSREGRKAAAKERADREKAAMDRQSQIIRQPGGDDVIIPTYRENRNGFRIALTALGGAALGALVVGYLIMPSRINSLQSDFNQTINSYSERLSAKEAVISANENEIEQLNGQIEALRGDVASADENTAGVAGEYSKLLQASQAMQDNEYLLAAQLYLTIDPTLVSDDTFSQIYASLNEEFTTNGYTVLFNAGMGQYNAGQYEAAAPYFEVCVSLDGESLEAKYWLGLSYLNAGEQELAYEQFNAIIAADPESDFAGYAREHMRASGSTTAGDNPGGGAAGTPGAENVPAETEPADPQSGNAEATDPQPESTTPESSAPPETAPADVPAEGGANAGDTGGGQENPPETTEPPAGEEPAQ